MAVRPPQRMNRRPTPPLSSWERERGVRAGARKWLLAALLLVALLPAPAVAQPADLPRNARTRATADGDTTLTLRHVRLVVPAGATAAGAVVALGVGGVPGRTGTVGTTGVVVSVAGGLRASAVVLIAPTAVDRAAAAGAPFTLIETATDAAGACRDGGVWIACAVPRPGAYLLGAAAAGAPGADDPLLTRALAGPPPDGTADSRPPFVFAVVVAVVAAAAGAVVALLSGGTKAEST